MPNEPEKAVSDQPGSAPGEVPVPTWAEAEAHAIADRAAAVLDRAGGGAGDGGGDPAVANDVVAPFRGLPMRELIGAPLKAAADAQFDLAATMVNYIEALAYDDKKKTRTLDFTLERPVQTPDGKIETSKMEVHAPLLGLVPVPALLVEDVNIDFQMEVKSVSKTTATEKADGGFEANAKAWGGWYAGSFTVRGSVGASRETTRQTDQTAKYQVSVKARQQPPSEGLSKLMDLLASTVEPIKVTTT